MLILGLGIGLLNRTEIQMADGAQRFFLTTPHFYADMGTEFGNDMCDRVKNLPRFDPQRTALRTYSYRENCFS